MRLLFSPTSPYARKVRVVITEKGLEDRVTEVPTNPMEPDADLVARNPLHKVPALVLDDGASLYDSRVICEYLDFLTPGPRLLPDSGDARWQALRRQALADGILDAALATVMELRRPEGERSAMWLDRWRHAITRGVAVAEGDLDALSGDLDMSQIAVASALDYLDFRLPDIAWQDSHGALAAWLRDRLARPAFRRTDPRG